MSNVVLFGSTGAIGSAIATELINRGHDVTGVTRTGTNIVDGVNAMTGNATNPDEVTTLVTGADAVICAIGPRHDGSDSLDILMEATHALVDGMRRAGVSRLIVV